MIRRILNLFRSPQIRAKRSKALAELAEIDGPLIQIELQAAYAESRRAWAEEIGRPLPEDRPSGRGVVRGGE